VFTFFQRFSEKHSLSPGFLAVRNRCRFDQHQFDVPVIIHKNNCMKIVNRYSLIILFLAAGWMLIEGCKKNDDVLDPNADSTSSTDSNRKTARDSAAIDYNTN